MFPAITGKTFCVVELGKEEMRTLPVQSLHDGNVTFGTMGGQEGAGGGRFVLGLEHAACPTAIYKVALRQFNSQKLVTGSPPSPPKQCAMGK